MPAKPECPDASIRQSSFRPSVARAEIQCAEAGGEARQDNSPSQCGLVDLFGHAPYNFSRYSDL